MAETEREKGMGDNQGKTEMSVASHISIRWLLWVARVLESAERIWQPLNPVPSDEEHCVV